MEPKTLIEASSTDNTRTHTEEKTILEVATLGL